MHDPPRDRDAAAPVVVRRSPAEGALLAPSDVADALVAADTRAVWQALHAELAAGASYVDVATDVVGPALAEVGARWADRRLTVAQEHLATANATLLLGRAFAKADVAPTNGRTAVFACVAGNQHALGVRVLSDAFALAGWAVRSLGADVPTEDLIAFVRAEPPDVLGLSLSHDDQVDAARAAIAGVRASNTGRTPFVVVGGHPFRSGALTAADVGADEVHADARSALHALG